MHSFLLSSSAHSSTCLWQLWWFVISNTVLWWIGAVWWLLVPTVIVTITWSFVIKNNFWQQTILVFCAIFWKTFVANNAVFGANWQANLCTTFLNHIQVLANSREIRETLVKTFCGWHSKCSWATGRTYGEMAQCMARHILRKWYSRDHAISKLANICKEAGSPP